VYNSTGSQQSSQHWVRGTATLGSSSGTVTVTLSGAAAFSSLSSYNCYANDQTSATGIEITLSSGTQFTLNGAQGGKGDSVDYLCVGS
jgi:hypothetical protein